MKRILMVCAALVVLGSAFTQTGQTVNPKQFDKEAMKKALLLKVNSYRSSNKAGALVLDKNLGNAAQDHADYLLKSGKLTHEQPSAHKKGVRERIRFHGGSVQVYAENIAEIYVQKRCSVYNARGEVDVKILRTYDDVAVAMVNGWNFSKGHRQNLRSGEYKRTGFGVAYDSKTQNVIVVQVFGG